MTLCRPIVVYVMKGHICFLTYVDMLDYTYVRHMSNTNRNASTTVTAIGMVAFESEISAFSSNGVSHMSW